MASFASSECVAFKPVVVRVRTSEGLAAPVPNRAVVFPLSDDYQLRRIRAPQYPSCCGLDLPRRSFDLSANRTRTRGFDGPCSKPGCVPPLRRLPASADTCGTVSVMLRVRFAEAKLWSLGKSNPQHDGYCILRRLPSPPNISFDDERVGVGEASRAKSRREERSLQTSPA